MFCVLWRAVFCVAFFKLFVDQGFRLYCVLFIGWCCIMYCANVFVFVVINLR